VIGVLVRMRLRVLARALREPRVLLGAVAGLVAAGLTVWVCARVFATQDATVDVVAALFAGWTIGWLIGPLLASRPAGPAERFAPPTTPRRVVGGLACMAFVGVPSAVSLVAFGGLVSFAGRDLGAVLVAVPAAVLQLALVVLLSRVVVTALGAAVRSRPARVLGLVVAVATGSAAAGAGPVLAAGHSAELSELVRALPTGWAPVAVDAAADGRWLVAVSCLLGLAALVAALLVGWADLVARRGVPTAPAPVIRKVA